MSRELGGKTVRGNRKGDNRKKKKKLKTRKREKKEEKKETKRGKRERTSSYGLSPAEKQ